MRKLNLDLNEGRISFRYDDVVENKLPFDIAYLIHGRETKIEEETQQYLYKMSNFVADVGGYMGLLLGVSFFTIYKTVVCFLSGLFNGKRKQKQKKQPHRKSKPKPKNFPLL